MRKFSLSKIRNFLFPALDRELISALDRQSMRNISNVSLAVFIFETLSILAFMTIEGWKLRDSTLISLLSVGFCALFSLVGFLISSRMKSRKDLPHGAFVSFKILFYAVYIVWAIHVDMRHYHAGDQMLTFFTVQLMMVCFVMFRPWLSILLTTCSYAGLYAAACCARGAEGIDVVNYVILAILSVVGMTIRFDTQIYLGRKEERLKSDTAVLEKHMRQDALTGLQNRLALEEDAKNTDGRQLSVYMIDINYFKEINDQFGHITGDEILKEIGPILQRLYPDAQYYRYGGDEFLVLSRKDPEKNYADTVYSFRKQTAKTLCTVTLSIGSARGNPETYDDLFSLISKADAALYTVKARTHSPEQGGHDRRRRPADSR